MTNENPSIVLLNGSELVCYPKSAQPETIGKDELDHTGTYLVVGNKKPKTMEKEQQDRATERDFFIQHAFFFLKNAGRILNDSRMFLAPVPIANGLAYTGSSGFHNPTLGVYLEWWICGTENILKDDEGNDALTYRIAGSPLSGCNSCLCVYPDGTTKTIRHSGFSSMCGSFIKINGRYTEAKQRYEAYSLREVYDMLSSLEHDEASELRTKLVMTEGRLIATGRRMDAMKGQISAFNERYDELSLRFRDMCVKFYREDLRNFKEEYLRHEAATSAELEWIAQRRRELKAEFRRGMYDNKEYQKKLHPLTARRKELKQESIRFWEDSLNNLRESYGLSREMVTDILFKSEVV